MPEEERTIVLAGREYPVKDIPGILKDKAWAVPVINFCRYAQAYGCPWGANLGWLDWPAAYFELRDVIDRADAEMEKDRIERERNK